jgi:hypothetical protein
MSTTGEALRIDIWDLLFDDINTEKMHRHGVGVRRAMEVLDGRPRVLTNHARDGAPFLVVGPDSGGRFVTLAIDPTAEEGVWRPRTAYPSKPGEIGRYRRLR